MNPHPEPTTRHDILLLWTPEVDGGQILETTGHADVPLRLEYVELHEGWLIEGLVIGNVIHQVTSVDLRPLKLIAQTVMSITLRVRNASADRRQFPGARIVGTVVR
jgi:hypothetical protein